MMFKTRIIYIKLKSNCNIDRGSSRTLVAQENYMLSKSTDITLSGDNNVASTGKEHSIRLLNGSSSRC